MPTKIPLKQGTWTSVIPCLAQYQVSDQQIQDMGECHSYIHLLSMLFNSVILQHMALTLILKLNSFYNENTLYIKQFEVINIYNFKVDFMLQHTFQEIATDALTSNLRQDDKLDTTRKYDTCFFLFNRNQNLLTLFNCR